MVAASTLSWPRVFRFMMEMGMRLQWKPKMTRHIHSPPTRALPRTEPTTGSWKMNENAALSRLVMRVATGPMTR